MPLRIPGLLGVAICLVLAPFANAAKEGNAEDAAETHKTGAIVHGSPQGGVAAFLHCDRARFAVGEPISFAYGLIAVEPSAGDADDAADNDAADNDAAGNDAAGNEGEARIAVAKPLEAVDPHNGSWFSVIGPDEQELPYQGEFVSWAADWRDQQVSLVRGEFVGKTSALNSKDYSSFDFSRTGKYCFRWHNGWDGPGIVSNEIRIKIVPAKSDGDASDGAIKESTADDGASSDEAAVAAQGAAPEVRILAGSRTTFGGNPFASFSCEIRNPSHAPLMFVGYRPDSFDPPIVEGAVAPIYVVEVKRDGEWQAHPLGWCGTGMDGILLPANESGAFGFAVPDEPKWEAVRVGVRWSEPIDFATAEQDAFQTAWSKPFRPEDLGAE